MLGIGRAKLGDLDGAVEDLRFAVTQAETAGSPGSSPRLSSTSPRRSPPAIRDRRRRSPQPRRAPSGPSHGGILQPLADLLARLEGASPAGVLSGREDEVARLVAEG